VSTERGAAGERAARRALRRAGYRILETNVHAASGEIDIVALDGDVLCLVEVKARCGPTHGTPEEALDSTKRRRLRAAAGEILRARGLRGCRHRFDLVAVDLSPAGEPLAVRILPGVL
jgi:putative endonuclease